MDGRWLILIFGQKLILLKFCRYLPLPPNSHAVNCFLTTFYLMNLCIWQSNFSFRGDVIVKTWKLNILVVEKRSKHYLRALLQLSQLITCFAIIWQREISAKTLSRRIISIFFHFFHRILNFTSRRKFNSTKIRKIYSQRNRQKNFGFLCTASSILRINGA